MEPSSASLWKSKRWGRSFAFIRRARGPRTGVTLTISFAVNRMSQDTSTALNQATIQAGGSVKLSSVDALALSVVAGALSFGGKLGFGASVAYNYIDSSVRSRIIASTVQLTGGGLLSVNAGRG